MLLVEEKEYEGKRRRKRRDLYLRETRLEMMGQIKGAVTLLIHQIIFFCGCHLFCLFLYLFSEENRKRILTFPQSCVGIAIASLSLHTKIFVSVY